MSKKGIEASSEEQPVSCWDRSFLDLGATSPISTVSLILVCVTDK